MPEAEAIWALGLMSGTSMDGVDGAMILSDGIEVFEFGATGFRPYSASERAIIAAAQGAWPGDAGVAEAEVVVRRAHHDLIARFGGVELIGFHGQTLAHDPSARGTHQIGDGAALAAELGLPVVWDFRSGDVAAGGQGAPLAPFYHFALAKRLGEGPVAFLNLGGVGNVTFANPLAGGPEDGGALLAFDTGPANALMDDFMQARTGLACDYGGAMAAAGQVDRSIVDQFLGEEYFTRKPPKSLDRNDFTGLVKAVEALSDMDGLATLAACTIASIKAGFRFAPKGLSRVLICGGGRKNDHLMAGLQAALTPEVVDITQAGFDGDMLEAQAFAYLALRCKAGLALSAPMTTGVKTPLT
ncbi:MAG: anhydro-N-acetylmuramic acid kinase, partial [Alphaproteobacteria bacterium]|nr:anhydro-N-acetylmuramic acid kinase [Alphaproteobacteria bacterium]